MTKPGALTLYGGIQSDFADGMHPYDSIPWRKKTTLKLVPFDNWAAYLDSSGAQAVYGCVVHEATRLGALGPLAAGHIGALFGPRPH